VDTTGQGPELKGAKGQAGARILPTKNGEIMGKKLEPGEKWGNHREKRGNMGFNQQE